MSGELYSGEPMYLIPKEGDFNLIKTTNVPFTVAVEITRPANTTQYAIRDGVNGNAAITLIELDLSAYGVSKKAIFNKLQLLSTNYAASTKLQADCKIFGINNPIADCTDNLAFIPTWDNLKHQQAIFQFNDATQPDVGTNAYCVGLWEGMQFITTTNTSGKLYLAVVCLNTYTPASAEKLYITGTGFIQ